MASPAYAILFSALVSGVSGGGSPGDVLIMNTAGTAFVLATSANRGTRRATGVALTSYANNSTVEIQQYGQIDVATANLGAGAASWVRVSTAGLLERCTPSGSDDVCGYVETDGTFHAAFGFLTAGIVNGAGGGATLPINLAGGAGTVINLLPAANQSPQTMGGDVGGTTAASTIAGLAVSKLAVSGTNGRVLTEVAGVAAWAAASGAATPWHNVPRVTKTANYTITSADYLVVCLTNTGFTITLPVSPNDGDAYVIYNQAAGTNFVGGNGHNIGPSGTYSLAQYESVAVVWDNAETAWTLVAAVKASGGSTPTGTGIPHIVGGVQNAASSLIVDADVSASAAIAGTKIAPSFGAQTVSSSTAFSVGGSPATTGNFNVGSGNLALAGRSSTATDITLMEWTALDRLYIGADSALTTAKTVSKLNFVSQAGIGFINAGGTYFTMASGMNASALPLTGDGNQNSPWGGMNGFVTHAQSGAGATDILSSTEYANSIIKVTGTGANVIKLKAVTDSQAYMKFIWNAGSGTLAVQDTNAVAAAATLAAGTGAWFLFATSAVKQMSAAFTVA